METHQTSDLRIAGSIPAMLVFLYDFFPVSALNTYSFFISLNGNVAQSVERKSHNLKVVSSILTVPTFFTFFPRLFPLLSSPYPLFVTILFLFTHLFLYGHMAQWKRIRLRI